MENFDYIYLLFLYLPYIDVGSLHASSNFNSFVFFDRGSSSHLMYEFEFQCSGSESRLQDCGQVALTEICATPGIGISCPLNGEDHGLGFCVLWIHSAFIIRALQSSTNFENCTTL